MSVMIFRVIAIVALLLSIWSAWGVWHNTKAIDTILKIFDIKDKIEDEKLNRVYQLLQEDTDK